MSRVRVLNVYVFGISIAAEIDINGYLSLCFAKSPNDVLAISHL